MNVLIVVLDDVGVDKVSAYGYPNAPPTPTMQALADDGLRFDRAWATPVCSPTRAALLSGQFAGSTTVGSVIPASSPAELPLSVVTIPEVLDRSGTNWSSAAIGKWHLSSPVSPSGLRHPTLQGFDLFSGSAGNVAGPYRVLDDRRPRTYYGWERVGFDGVTVFEEQFSTIRITNDAIEALGRLPEPFFLYVAYHAAHRPLDPPPEELLSSPRRGVQDEESVYDANVEAADHELGRLLGALGELRERTLILVIGDNGTPRHAKDEDGAEGAKGSFTEGGLGVPFLLSGPGVTTRGSTDALVSVVDVLPTLAELAGSPVDDLALDGLSLVPLFTDREAGGHTRLYSELRHPAEGPPWRSITRAARDEDLKVIDDDGVRTWWRLEDDGEDRVVRRQLSRSERRRIAMLEAEIDARP